MPTENFQKGYSQEEEFFHKTNKELIDKKRQELNTQQSSQSSENRTPHWMKCPKCGNEMKEIDLAGIKLDQCVSCQGIYFDSGELEILMDSKEPKGFLGAMKRLFR